MVTRRGLLASLGALGTGGLAGCLAAPESGGAIWRQQLTALPPAELSVEGQLDADTSGDGIPDLVVAAHDLNPERKHAFVSIDVDTDRDYTSQLAFARQVFATAPIANPNGSTGIDVHFLIHDSEPVEEEAGALTYNIPVYFHWDTETTSGFDHRHRGHRHLVLTDNLGFDGWIGNKFVLGIEQGLDARLVDLLAAQFAGRFDPLIETGETGPAALEELWFPEEKEVSAGRLHAGIDWELVEANLPKTTPSTYWYEQQYAHMASDRFAREPRTELPEDRSIGHDTSRDGIPDSLLTTAEVFEDASPLRKNIFVEVDHLANVSRETVQQQMETVQTVFADAPVRNPDGSMGIDLHYTIEDEIPETNSITIDDVTGRLKSTYFRHEGQGFFYMVFTEVLEDANGTYDQNSIATEPNPATVLHELGHALGLLPFLDGVDDRKFTFVEHPSVMNYNRPDFDPLCFSSGDGHRDAVNDWELIDEQLADRVPYPTELMAELEES